MRTSSAWRLGVVGVLGACAGAGRETAPDRALFRLTTRGVVPQAAAVVTEEEAAPRPPEGPPVAAFRVALQVRRADGTVLLAPTVVAFAGQRATVQSIQQLSFIQDFDAEIEDDVLLADPIIGVLQSGWTFGVAALDVPGAPGEAALAFALKAGDVRKPLAARSVGRLSPQHEHPVTIQFPRVESVEVTGARRVALGATVEIARLPDPTGVGELVVDARVDREMVPGPAPDLLSPRGAEDQDAAATRALGTLGAVAASGRASRGVRVTAVRMPAGVDDPDGLGVERLATLRVDSVLAPGVRTSDRLEESYLREWDVVKRRHLADPVVATHGSGLSAEVADGDTLVVRWRTTPTWHQMTTYGSGSGDTSWPLQIDQPVSTEVERRVALAPGRSVHPVFRLDGGGVAAVVVDVSGD
jgi:hypothetical protein